MIKKKTFILLINILGLSVLLYLQHLGYQMSFEMDSDIIHHDEVLLKAALMRQSGIDLNWLTGLCLSFLLINGLLYRYWVMSKRWILEPIIILILSFGICLSYQLKEQFRIARYIHEEKNENVSVPKDSVMIRVYNKMDVGLYGATIYNNFNSDISLQVTKDNVFAYSRLSTFESEKKAWGSSPGEYFFKKDTIIKSNSSIDCLFSGEAVEFDSLEVIFRYKIMDSTNSREQIKGIKYAVEGDSLKFVSSKILQSNH